jgi:phosphoglycerate-specific signal transduction histidine kinase
MKLADEINMIHEYISKDGLKKAEALLDKLFKVLNIDVEFTRHFHDRINDPRNVRDITLDELFKIYMDVFKKHGKTIAKLPDDAEAIMKDISSDVNIPFVLNYDPKRKMIDMVAKTIMRKKNFKSSSRFYKV